MPLQPGTTLGPYSITAKIGEGGMGEVYKARDTRLDRTVAMKVLPGHVAADPDLRRRFEREARTVAALNHPHICTLHDIGSQDGTDFLVMEYLDGETLAQRLTKGALTLDQALKTAIEIADALDTAHRHGITHRDLKPGNIFLTTSGAKLLDFGLAKLLADSEGDATRTVAGTVLGTAAYMSPEQAQGQSGDARSDVFSFGAVLYEVLSGQRAFGRASILDTLNAVVRDEPVLRESPAAAIVTRCLTKQPSQRFQTMADVKAALQWVRMAPTEQAQKSPSIAVLPFVNMSPDQENLYFSDGLSEEIINALAKLPGLRVIARTSAFRFRGEQNLRKVGEALDVGTVLEGSVRKAGNRLRITAQLINVADDSHIWSERFDRELTDVFAIQDEIAAAIVQQLQVSLGGSRRETRAARRPTTSVAAYEALLEGRHHWYMFTPAGLEKALACLERALSLDPDYADAIVEMAHYHGVVGWTSTDPRETLTRMKALAERALSLDPDHGEAHGALAFCTLWSQWDWKAADRFFRRAIVLAPASPVVLALFGVTYLLGQGAFEEATTSLDRALAIDPLAALVRGNKARVLTCARRFDEAEAQCRRALELDPMQLLTRLELGYALAFQHKYEEALAIAQEAIRAHGHVKIVVPLLGVVHAMAGRRDEALGVLQKMEEVARTTYVTPLTGAVVNAALGDLDAAFEWAGKAVDERDGMMMYLHVHPLFDALRADARYPALLQRVNLP